MSGQFSRMAARERRRGLVVRLVLIGVLLVALVLSALLWPRPQPGGLRVATAAGEPGSAGVLKGALEAERSGDLVCFAVRAANGAAVLRFPEGWSSDPELDLRDGSGAVAAQPGERVVVLGTPGQVGSAPGCDQQGRVWTVSSVRLQAS